MSERQKSAKKHNGKLPASSDLSVDGEVRWAGSFISIRCGMNIVMLDRQQALSLHRWLDQMKEE